MKTLLKLQEIVGEKSGQEVDKFEIAKLTLEKGNKVNAPTIKESLVSIECKVVKEVEVVDHVWFMVEVVAAHAHKGYKWNEEVLFK